MTPCRTEKVDFSKKLKKTNKNKKKNRITKKNKSTGRITRRNKKKQKKTKTKTKTAENAGFVFFFDFFFLFFPWFWFSSLFFLFALVFFCQTLYSLCCWTHKYMSFVMFFGFWLFLPSGFADDLWCSPLKLLSKYIYTKEKIKKYSTRLAKQESQNIDLWHPLVVKNDA